jgi:hypothetical protein
MSTITLTQGTITKIATSTTAKILRNLSRDVKFLVMDITTGAAAPTNAEISANGYLIFEDNPMTEELEFNVLSDVYAVSINGNGKIRVDDNATNNMSLVDEDGVSYGVKQIDGKPRTSCMPYLYDISEGNVPGHLPFSKIGYMPSLSAGVNTDVWGYSATQPVYVFPTAAMGMEILSSNNVDDIATVIKSGTSTGGSTISLIDTGADFTAATAVAVGDIVILDKSGTVPEWGYVSGITSATELAISGGFSSGGTGSGRTYSIIDYSAKAGAVAVRISYLDGSYAQKDEIVLLNGTTVVPTVNLNLFRINNFRVIGTGANGVPTGGISIRHLSDTPVYSYIAAGFNRARNSIYTVPAGKTVYITDYIGAYATTGNANKEYARITARANFDPDLKFKTDGMFYPIADLVTQNATAQIKISTPMSIPEKVDIKISAVASATGIISTTLIGWIESNS